MHQRTRVDGVDTGDAAAPLFGPGDHRVRARRAGPLMHVVATTAHHCHCNWVDAFGVLQRGTFDRRDLLQGWPDEPSASLQQA